MSREKTMSAIWLLNALENALHEPNCLMQQILDEGALQEILPDKTADGERAYAEQEVKTFRQRLAISKELLERLDRAADKLEG